jgi:hypothetical protein
MVDFSKKRLEKSDISKPLSRLVSNLTNNALQSVLLAIGSFNRIYKEPGQKQKLRFRKAVSFLPFLAWGLTLRKIPAWAHHSFNAAESNLAFAFRNKPSALRTAALKKLRISPNSVRISCKSLCLLACG